MKYFVKENTWLDGMDHGWGNGYVVIPKGHPMHGKHYGDDLFEPVEVNGGLTFADNAPDWPEVPEGSEGAWVVGFDTAHYMDTKTRWPKEAVEAEAKRLMEQLEAMIKTTNEISENKVD